MNTRTLTIMRARTRLKQAARLLTLLAALLPAGQALAQADAKVLKDLGTVIALQGHPCGQAVKADKRGDNDYLVTCQSGDRYRVTIDENDRVVIKKQ